VRRSPDCHGAESTSFCIEAAGHEPYRLSEKVLMNNEMIGATDQEGGRARSMAQLLTSAERELSAFVAAVDELFGAEQARQAAENWIEELARTDWPSEAPVIGWRRVTIAAAARLVGRNKGQLSRN
jgi:hypothetical protein